MSKNLTINGAAYNGISNVTIGSAIFRDADEVITIPTATKAINENGTNIDVLNYSKVNVNVPGVQPTGTLSIETAESGTWNCSGYAQVAVTVVKDSGAPVLSSISATYSGGAVAAGTTLTQLTGISITATYTMAGYTGNIVKSGITSGYTLSGTLTPGQTNTITVSYGGKTTTIQVPVAAEPLVLDKLVVTYDNSTPVAAGTALSALNEVVKAQYTNGTQTGALTEGTDYELSGTLTAGQTNTITVTGKGAYAGLASVAFSVTVAEAPLVLEKLIVTYDNTNAVEAGTALSALNEVVKAQYTNGTQTAALAEGTDYELSGTLTAGQTNTITVTGKGVYAGLAAVTFSVTVKAETVSATNYWISDSIAGLNGFTMTFQIPGLTSTDYDNIQYIDLSSEQTTKGSTPGTGVSQMRLKKESGVWTLKSVYRENSAEDLSSSATLTSVVLGSEAITITISGLVHTAALTYWITCYDAPSSLPTGNANQYWSQATIVQNGGGSQTFAFPTRLNKGLIKQSADFTSITIIQDSSHVTMTYNANIQIAANKLILTKNGSGDWTGEVTYTVYSSGATATATATATVSITTDEIFGNTLISLTAQSTSGASIAFYDSGKDNGTVSIA